VTGLVRSEASAAASILSHFGNCLIKLSQIRNHKDLQLRDLWSGGMIDEIVEFLLNRCVGNTYVAWKGPKIYGCLGRDLVEKLKLDWLVVVIFRDPIATAMRRALSE
jgi:hypothetical protein